MKQLLLLSIFISFFLPSKEAFTANESFTFVGQEGYRPFNIREIINGKVHYSGLDIEIIQAAAATAEVDVKFMTLPWSRAIFKAQKGDVDGIFNFGWKEEREAHFYYPSTPIRFVNFDFFVNDSYVGDVKNLSDLKDSHIGLVRNYYISEQLNAAESQSKYYATSTEQLFQLLNKNRINVAIYSRISGLHALKYFGVARPKIRRYPYLEAKPYPSYLAFSKNSPKGKRAYEVFSKALEAIKNDGTINRIYKKYIKQLDEK